MNDRNHNQVITKHSKPISKDHLIRVSDELTRLGTKKALRDKTIVMLGWMAALRVSEIQNLRVNDFIKEEGGYILKLYKSKNLKVTPNNWFNGLSYRSFCNSFDRWNHFT